MTKPDVVKIKNNRPRLYSANGVTLQPGLNELTPVDAGLFLSHPHVKIKHDRGFIKLISGEAIMPEGMPGAGTRVPVAFDDEESEQTVKQTRANAADTITLIKGAENREAVVPFLNDDRTTVVAAAQAKLSELDAGV